MLKQSIVDGVRAGHFALCEGTCADDAKVMHFKAELSPQGVMLEEGYLLVRPDLAEQKLEAEKAKAAGGTSVGTVTPTPTPGIGQPTPGSTTTTVVPGSGTSPGGGTTVTPPGGTETTTSKGGKPGRVTLDVEVPFTDFHTFYTGVINALGRGADAIKIRVQIEASADSGFSQTLIEDRRRRCSTCSVLTNH